MKKMLVTCSGALALALAAFSPATLAQEFPGSSADPGNRIICQFPAEFGGDVHQSPGLCAQAMGELLTTQGPMMGLEPGFTGGPGQAFKYMRDNFEGLNAIFPDLFVEPPTNAHDCIGMNCANHAGDL